MTLPLCTMPGCPDSDELVTFEDLLEGKAGPVEQQSALQFQRLTDAGQTSQHVEPPGRVFADETGPDLRIGEDSGRLILIVTLASQHCLHCCPQVTEQASANGLSMPPQTHMPIQQVSSGTVSHCTLCSSAQSSHKAELAHG